MGFLDKDKYFLSSFLLSKGEYVSEIKRCNNSIKYRNMYLMLKDIRKQIGTYHEDITQGNLPSKLLQRFSNFLLICYRNIII